MVKMKKTEKSLLFEQIQNEVEVAYRDYFQMRRDLDPIWLFELQTFLFLCYTQAVESHFSKGILNWLDRKFSSYLVKAMIAMNKMPMADHGDGVEFIYGSPRQIVNQFSSKGYTLQNRKIMTLYLSTKEQEPILYVVTKDLDEYREEAMEKTEKSQKWLDWLRLGAIGLSIIIVIYLIWHWMQILA